MEYASKVTTRSHSLYTALKKYYNIELLPHGIDDYWYTTDPKVYSPEPIRLITVSRLLEMKNIQITLHAIAQLKHAGVTITLSVVGDGEYKNELKRLTESLGIAEQVKFYGWLTSSEIIALYKQHQIFIMLSYPETFGRAYFEAAAQGLLIIGVNDTGAHGHFSNEEAFFIEPSRDEVVRILQNLTPSVYSRKTSLAMQKISTYKNPVIINKYYNILNEIRDNFSKKSFTSF